MGAIEDVRQVLQDVIAPDLKAMQAEIRTLVGRMDRNNVQMQALQSSMLAVINLLTQQVSAYGEAQSLRTRVEALERRMSPTA